MSLLSIAGKRPFDLGVSKARLSGCPGPPNCVSSNADRGCHHIAPFEPAIDVETAWQEAREAVLALLRTRVVTDTGTYLHAECRSKLFGFVDDLELHLCADENIIEVRSASRLGHFDFRANRERVESLRALLRERGVVR